jgi:hypothetical protein
MLENFHHFRREPIVLVVPVSLLEEKARSHGTAEACIRRMEATTGTFKNVNVSILGRDQLSSLIDRVEEHTRVSQRSKNIR